MAAGGVWITCRVICHPVPACSSCKILPRAPLEAVETTGPSQLAVTGLKVCRVEVLEFVADVFSSPVVTSYHVPTCVTLFLEKSLPRSYFGACALTQTKSSQAQLLTPVWWCALI